MSDPASLPNDKIYETSLKDEVEKRYLAYALSTIVSRALPDVRDGLKPVHRRILYAMHGMKLGDSSKMRKSAAIVGEVIGKYHPHGDQAAYDALVRMAQDFSLRYPLIEGTGNFGSIDGDSPAAMRYTETRLSRFSGLLLQDIDEGTTDFRPTYDGIGEEPDVLPAAVPNLLLNGSSGIAVGMSCSFPPHNLGEIVAACRAAIKNPDLDVNGLMEYINGPDFPTGAEIIESHERLREIYESGHGSIRVRGTYKIEQQGRGKTLLVITALPYSVNKAKLVERIAVLIREKRLRNVFDVRDESAEDIRVVLEIRGTDIKPESIVAFLYRHTELQINFPMNFIAINPQGSPDRLSLDKIIKYFLEFRYHKTVRRLNHLLEILRKRIHILEGFEILFDDLDKAIAIIRSSRSRAEAASGLKDNFTLDDEQVDAILETRLYKIVGIEIGRVLDELASKRKQAKEIERDLSSPARIWKIIDRELEKIADGFTDPRRSRIVPESEAEALDYDVQTFVDQEDTTVILSRQGWIRRIKSEVENVANLKFREGDSLLGIVRTNTLRTVTVFTNRGKIYSVRSLDVPATGGFGEPLGSMLRLDDGEIAVALMAPEPTQDSVSDDIGPHDEFEFNDEPNAPIDQPSLFVDSRSEELENAAAKKRDAIAVLITRKAKGFRFDLESLKEPTKRLGRKLVNLEADDEVVAVKNAEAEFALVAESEGHILMFRLDHVPIMSGPARGVVSMKIREQAEVVGLEVVGKDDSISLIQNNGETNVIPVGEIRLSARGGRGKKVSTSIVGIERSV
ncbi:MAG: DNA topoisomerase (ATP-hydrolyzing) subunit A [Desulfomonilaceae bacterium]